MTARVTRLLIISGAFVAGLLAVFAVIFALSGLRTGSSVLPVAPIGGPFQLTDQNGRSVTERDFKGKPFLVFFGFTHCPDVCPTTLFEVSEIMRHLGADADRTAALFITVDPERDTPAKLKEYLESFDPHVVGLTGEPASLAAVLKTYRVYYKKVPTEGGDYTMDHTALVYLMDKNGQFVSPFNLKRPAEAAAADLRKHL